MKTVYPPINTVCGGINIVQSLYNGMFEAHRKGQCHLFVCFVALRPKSTAMVMGDGQFT